MYTKPYTARELPGHNWTRRLTSRQHTWNERACKFISGGPCGGTRRSSGGVHACPPLPSRAQPTLMKHPSYLATSWPHNTACAPPTGPRAAHALPPAAPITYNRSNYPVTRAQHAVSFRTDHKAPYGPPGHPQTPRSRLLFAHTPHGAMHSTHSKQTAQSQTPGPPILRHPCRTSR